MQEIAKINLAEAYPVNNFYQAIHIYLRKTQVVNRKLSCSANVAFLKLKVSTKQNVNIKSLARILEESSSCDVETIKKTLLLQEVESAQCDLDDLKSFDDELQEGIYLSIDRMIPRNMQKFSTCIVATLIDLSQVSAKFQTIVNSDNLMPSPIFQFQYTPAAKTLALTVENNSDSNWLQYVLQKKINNWMENSNKQQVMDSHSLIDSETYNDTYASLKEKYGRSLEEGWTESTDPKKFIYEDIAIASYLIILWQQEREQSGINDLQSFADLGCGNGLLVYILTEEGHRGYGIDLRKRRIWDRFPKTDLREIAIVPSDDSLFADVDWIIGNHSDELSPWIPVISARSSFDSKYFLLPCCSFEFSGAKYQRKGGTKSQYLSFVDYLLTVSEACGFASTKLDRLKIPSTKRICIIGTGRTFERSQFQLQCEKIQDFINESNAQQGSPAKWAKTFEPREKIEPIRNCLKIDRSLSDSIVQLIFNQLLATPNYCDEFPGWNCGSEMPISDAVKLVSSDDLKKLKAECGGLQTLMRNRHQIFHVYGGTVRIRTPQKLSEKVISEKTLKRRNVIKSSPCYFFYNHSCPLSNADCSYQHE